MGASPLSVSPFEAESVASGKATVTIPLQTTLLFTRSNMAPFVLRLSEFDDVDVPLQQNAKRPRGVWAEFQWVQTATSRGGAGQSADQPQRDIKKEDIKGSSQQPPFAPYRVTSTNLDPTSGPLPGYQFPLYESGSPYTQNGVVYTAAIQPGLVMVMERLDLNPHHPTVTLSLAQYQEHAPCRLDKFKFERQTRVGLPLGPVGPTQVDVHQVDGTMTLRGAEGGGGPGGVDVFIKEKVKGHDCEAGFNPTLVKGDYAYITEVGRIRVDQIKDYPPSDPNLVGAPVGEAKLTLKTW